MRDSRMPLRTQGRRPEVVNVGVETKSTRQNQTNTIPSAIGHAQTDAHPKVTRKSILEASLGVSVPLWFLRGDSR